MEWKHVAQERAFRELVAPGLPERSAEVERVGSIIMADNACTVDTEFDQLFLKVRAAAQVDVAAYTQTPIWSSGSIELTLALYNDQTLPSFSISKLPLALEAAPELTIVSPPGTGKTTTLLQLARHVLAAHSIIPLYFRLGDWSASSSTLLATLHGRSAFRT
jgi:hypothetical protein